MRGGEALGTPTLGSIEALGRQNQELREELERLRAEIETLKSGTTSVPTANRRTTKSSKKASSPARAQPRKVRRAARPAKREPAGTDEFDISRIVDAGRPRRWRQSPVAGSKL